MISSMSHGILTISIDVETGAALDVREQRSREAMVARMLDILAKHQVSATWALSDPAASPLAASIRAMRAGHEIAIAASASWAAPIVPRVRFGRELAARTIAARAVGLDLSSLVIKTPDLGDHYDLVFKQGLTAVRLGSPSQNHSLSRRVQPATPRFGLWTFGVWCWLPGRSRLWAGGGGGRTARAAIDRAAGQPSLAQLAIDLQGMIDRGSAAVRILERVLARAASHRRQGRLEIITLAESSRRLTTQCTSKPSRSILRPAA